MQICFWISRARYLIRGKPDLVDPYPFIYTPGLVELEESEEIAVDHEGVAVDAYRVLLILETPHI